MKQPLKHLSIKVTPQTYYHLTQLAAMAGYTNLGKVVDKLVREHQLSMTYREGGLPMRGPYRPPPKKNPVNQYRGAVARAQGKDLRAT